MSRFIPLSSHLPPRVSRRGRLEWLSCPATYCPRCQRYPPAPPMELSLGFHGGARTVTGSRYLLHVAGRRLLVDAGLFQGLKTLRQLNWQEPDFDPRSVDGVLLTHAHVDHSGYLPRLVRNGYSGPVYCTPATLDLAKLLLLDSAKIHEEEASYANRRGFSKHRPALPLYTTDDAEAAINLMRPVPYREWVEPGAGIEARFLNVGHILGAAMIELRISRGSAGRLATTVVFSGDVGRYGVPLHSDPLPPPVCDFLVMESTYGNRSHDRRPLESQLREPVQKTLDNGGTVLIPSFAVGRAQLVTLIFRELMKRGKLPEVPIHIDSPMAIDATRIYSEHLRDESLDEELVDEGRSRLFPRQVEFHRTVEQSKALNELPGPPHPHFIQRDAHRRKGSSPLATPLTRGAELDPAGRLSGRRHAGSRPDERGPVPEGSRPPGPGPRPFPSARRVVGPCRRGGAATLAGIVGRSSPARSL